MSTFLTDNYNDLLQFQTPGSKLAAVTPVSVRSRGTQSTGQVEPSYSQVFPLRVPPNRPAAALWGPRWARDALRRLEVG